MIDLLNGYKAVIFDMDGTIVDSIPYHEKAWLLFLKKYGIDINESEFRDQNHGTIDEMILHFFGNNISKKRITELGLEKESLYRELFIDHIKEINGLTNFLLELSNNGFKIALATNSDIPNIEFIMNCLGIGKYFDCITGGHEVIRGKPDPEIYLLTLDRLKVSKQEAIVFEDSKGGVISASSAGLGIIGITTSENRENLLKFGCVNAIGDYVELMN